MSIVSPLTPAAVFSQLFPPGTVFAPRSTLSLTQWVHYEAFRLDALSGITMTVMGDMPLICHQNTATPLILDFFRKAGLFPAANFTTYESEEEAVALARECISRGKKLVYVYPPPPLLSEADGLLIPLSLYNWLNDKANLAYLVDEDYLACYQVVSNDSLFQLNDFMPGEAVFVKACNPGASGAGIDVFYCPDASTRVAAREWIACRMTGLSGVRIEEEVELSSCWCLSLAILESDIRYLGAATQLFAEPAKQCGSRIDPDDLPPDSVVAIAQAIAARAQRIGYRGIAGFDIGIASAGHPYVFDLNFRLAGSTPQVLLHDAAVKRAGACISQSWQTMVKGALAPTLKRMWDFVYSGRFVPIRLFEATSITDGRSIITGMVVASTLAEIELIIADMQAALQDLV